MLLCKGIRTGNAAYKDTSTLLVQIFLCHLICCTVLEYQRVTCLHGSYFQACPENYALIKDGFSGFSGTEWNTTTRKQENSTVSNIYK